VLTGIDEVDWASLRHAYGSAEDVPGLLRGLASTDPAEREVALDGMYGAVHHQGDVYDATIACVPFLFALAGSEEVPDRGGLVELLVSIGGEGEDQEAGGGAEASRGAEASTGAGRGMSRSGSLRGPCASAHAAVRAGGEVFVRLIGDGDAGVRRAAPAALVRFLDEPARVLGLLRERFVVERDDRVLLALAESLGFFVRRHPGHAAGALDLLTAQSSPPYGPGLRLAALGQLAHCAPDRLPSDLVSVAVGLLKERSRLRPAGHDESGPPETDTLVGRLRRLRPSDEEGSQLLRTLHTALGGRVDERIALLRGQLTSPDPADRCNAVWMSTGLFREWRADYSEPVAVIGAQLGAEEDRLREAAVYVLTDLFELAAPAADDLAALVASRPDLWVRRWERGAPTLGDPLKALARSGDPRAVAVLAEVLAGPVVPDDLGHVIVHLGPAAAPVAPALRRGLGSVDPGCPEKYGRAVPLLAALTALGDGQAVPEVLRVLRGALEASGPGNSLVGSSIRAVDAFGPAAREAIPVLRGLLDSEHAAAAAGALWSVEGDASAVLPVLLRESAADDPRRRGPAAEGLARLGPSARTALPALLRTTGSGQVWERVSAGCAVCRIGGEVEPVEPVLRSAWAENPHTRGTIAECLAAMGTSAAPLRDLAEAELTAPRRHTARPGGHGSHGSHDIPNDEELVRWCREVVSEGG
jgi:hypothetical protein